jgi:tetratricopeptide (TPR) repeat protein
VATAAAFFVALQPDPAALIEQGLQIQQARPTEAEQLFRRAAASEDGASSDASLALACLLARRGEWSEAGALFARIDSSTARADLLLHFGQLAYENERDDLARAALEPLVERDVRECSAALELLAGLHQRLGRQNAAIDALQSVARREPDDFDHWRKLIEILKVNHREQACLDAAREALQHNPPAVLWGELQFQVLQQLIVLGDSSEAWRVMANLEAASGQSARLQSMRVDLLRMDGRLDEALQVSNDVLSEFGNQPSAYLARGSIYLDLGRFAEAAQDLERVVADLPFDERTHFKLSEAYRGLGQDEPARYHRETGIDLWEKRVRLNSLLEQFAESQDGALLQDVISLYRDLGEVEAADYWQQQAELRHGSQ